MSNLRLGKTGLSFLGRRFPCTVGKGGIQARKVEGDGATPTGIHRVVGMFYRPDRMTPPQPWAMPISHVDLWCDDSSHPDYNQHVWAPFDASHERLWRADPLYDLVLVLDYNWPKARPGFGSAIFLHQWSRPGFPTEGCIAFRRDHLRWIARRIAFGAPINVPENLVG